MLAVIREMNNVARVPLLAKPNAGMPKLKDGVTVFDMGAVEFASYADDFIKAGANILGGCCGTTPDHIFELAKNLKGKIGHGKREMGLSALSSARKSVFIGGGGLSLLLERG
jgi:5-methyltetrahydrofolate--homocysteine methyltransferase